MKTHDYLHSDLLAHPDNNKVFQETYETIRKLSWTMSGIYSDALNLNKRQREEYQDLFIDANSELIINLVNYTIHHFNKDYEL